VNSTARHRRRYGLLVLLPAFILTSSLAGQNSPPRIVHVFVALADNLHQGIAPVPARLGNGDDPAHNLYWGAAGGVKTFFVRSGAWALLSCSPKPKPEVLERCLFKHRQTNTYMVADAYRGSEIREALIEFFDAAAGVSSETVAVLGSAETLTIRGGSNLVTYVGHDGLMEFQLPLIPKKKNDNHRDAVILACASKQYFAATLRTGGAYPLLWTTNLMAPLDGWIAGETAGQIRDRAASAYDKYQKCGYKAARRLFATGW